MFIILSVIDVTILRARVPMMFTAHVPGPNPDLTARITLWSTCLPVT